MLAGIVLLGTVGYHVIEKDFEINHHRDRKLKVGDTLVVLGDLQHLDDRRKEIGVKPWRD